MKQYNRKSLHRDSRRMGYNCEGASRAAIVRYVERLMENL